MKCERSYIHFFQVMYLFHELLAALADFSLFSSKYLCYNTCSKITVLFLHLVHNYTRLVNSL